MLRKLWILCSIIVLTSCTTCPPNYCSPCTRLSCEERFARCEELRHQIIFSQSTKEQLTASPNVTTMDQLSAAQETGQLDNIYREYRALGC